MHQPYIIHELFIDNLQFTDFKPPESYMTIVQYTKYICIYYESFGTLLIIIIGVNVYFFDFVSLDPIGRFPVCRSFITSVPSSVSVV